MYLDRRDALFGCSSAKVVYLIFGPLIDAYYLRVLIKKSNETNFKMFDGYPQINL